MLALYGIGEQAATKPARRLLHTREQISIAPRIVVNIKRQAVFNLGSGPSIVRTYIVGTSSFHSVPPGYVPPDHEHEGAEIVTNDHEGHITFVPNLSSSFDIGKLRVTVSTSQACRPVVFPLT